MRILQVIPALPDFMGDSGQVLILAKYFQALGHHVTIATTDGDPFVNNLENSRRYAKTRKILLDAKGGPAQVNGIPVYAAHCNFPQLGMYSMNAGRLADKLVKDADIVHIYSWYHHPGIAFYKAAHKHRVPYFVSVWGTLQPEAQEFRKWEKKLVDFLYTRKMIRHAAGLHSIGESENVAYEKWGGNPGKIHRIDNGVAPEYYVIKEETKILERLGIADKSYIIFLGRINEKKGLEYLLRACVRLVEARKDIMLIIAGSGTEGYVEKVKKLVEELGLTNSVKFVGLVSENEKLELLKSARLFALTSINDIHPRAVQDALAMGLPVLITKVCDYPEVDEYKAGITVELSVDSIYSGLEKMLGNEENLAEFSKNARRMIEERFAMIDQVKKYEKLYLDILAAR